MQKLLYIYYIYTYIYIYIYIFDVVFYSPLWKYIQLQLPLLKNNPVTVICASTIILVCSTHMLMARFTCWHSFLFNFFGWTMPFNLLVSTFATNSTDLLQTSLRVQLYNQASGCERWAPGLPFTALPLPEGSHTGKQASNPGKIYVQ